jgi:predicted transcriptional regulator
MALKYLNVPVLMMRLSYQDSRQDIKDMEKLLGEKGIADRGYLAQRSGKGLKYVSSLLRRMCNLGLVEKGAAMKKSTGRAVFVYTLEKNRERFHGTATSMYDCINMRLEI